jgi:hypothetical protein
MHFLGGLFIAASLMWVMRYEVPIRLRSHIPVFLVSFVAVFAVGVTWEAFEYTTGMYQNLNHPLDTTMDLAMDMTGMLFSYLLFTRYVR